MVDVKTYECNSCGGPIQFNPELQNLKCDYCGHTTDFDPGEVEIKTYSLEDGIEQCDTDWRQETRVVHCDSCGADTVLEGAQKAQLCPFCDSSHVTNISNDPGIKPELVIPFKLNDQEAKGYFQRWIKKKFFAQGNAKKSKRIDNLRGVYVPYWLFDVDTSTAYRGSRGIKHYHEEETTIQWRDVSGVYDHNFRDFPICGSTQVENLNLSEDRLIFDYQGLKAYDPGYLAGFVAERYERDFESSWQRAKKKMDSLISMGVRKQIGGDEQRIYEMNTGYSNPRYKHVLCPIWISVFKYKGKEYPFIVNGQTGETEGKYPLSIPKVAAVIAAGAAALGILYSLI